MSVTVRRHSLRIKANAVIDDLDYVIIICFIGSQRDRSALGAFADTVPDCGRYRA